MRTIATIDGRDIVERDDMSVLFFGPFAVDCDGSDNRHRDSCWQRGTSLTRNGQPIDAESVPYGVTPPAIIRGVRGIVLGCRGIATNMQNGLTSAFVVADVGPRAKMGEGSCELARRLGLDGNPNHGGTSEHIIRWEFWPGVAAVVDGVTYSLKAS